MAAERLPAGALTATLASATATGRATLAGAWLPATALSAPPVLQRAELRVLGGEAGLADWRLLLPVGDGDRVVLGRGTAADVRLSHATVSRLHLEIACRGDQYVVTDLRSTCGSLHNDQPLQGPTVLHDGDRLRLGDVELVFGRGRAFPVLPEPPVADAPVVNAIPVATADGVAASAATTPADDALTPIAAAASSPFVPPPPGAAAIVRLRTVRRFPTDVVLAVAFVAVAAFVLWSIGTELFAGAEVAR